jgi:hypothetical protein
MITSVSGSWALRRTHLLGRSVEWPSEASQPELLEGIAFWNRSLLTKGNKVTMGRKVSLPSVYTCPSLLPVGIGTGNRMLRGGGTGLKSRSWL